MWLFLRTAGLAGLFLVDYFSSSLLAAEKLAGNQTPAAAITKSFAAWRAACEKLPPNRVLRAGQWPRRDLLPIPKFTEFDAVLDAFFLQCKTGMMSQATHWAGSAPNPNTFFNTGTAYFEPSRTVRGVQAIPFEPFAQKLQLPENCQIYFRADLHGDIRSLLLNLGWLTDNGYLKDFTIIRPGFYMVFLGDYTDRGRYGIEVLYTLLRLKLANADKVFLARGNHEEVGLQERFGFLEEGEYKYGGDFKAAKVERAYDFFPLVIYAGCGTNFIQCNHGGMEPGFNPQFLLSSGSSTAFQLLGKLGQKTFLSSYPNWLPVGDGSRAIASAHFVDFVSKDPGDSPLLGFMWNDFSVFSGEAQLADDPKRAFIYGAESTRFLLRASSGKDGQIHAVFRGHQQSVSLNPMMRRLIASRGVFRHWQQVDLPSLKDAPVSELSRILEHGETRSIPPGSVWTFNVAPDSVYGDRCDYTFDSFGLLTLANSVADWRLRVVNIEVAR